MKIKKLAQTGAVAAACILGASSVNAATIYGQMEQVYNYGSGAYLYVSPYYSWAIPDFVWYCQTSDRDLMLGGSSFLHKNVRLYTGSSCSTSGTYRYCGVCSGVVGN